MAANVEPKIQKISSVSERGLRYINVENPLQGNFRRWAQNSYDKTTNPEGIVNLGTSENKILADIVVPKLNESLQLRDEHTHYFPCEGVPRFRENMANFLERYMKPAEKINPDHIFAFNGCGSAIQSLGAILCNPGEGIIIPAPYYGGFDDDLYTGPQIVRIPAHLSNKSISGNKVEFQLTVDVLEKSLMKAKEQNVTVRAFLLCNPQNPLGIVFSEQEVRLCMEFCQKHSLHLISDEIYLLSIFKDDCSMTSSLAIEPGLLDPDLLHIIWGFSKDFGLSGIRAAVVYSRNLEIIAALKATACFTTIPAVLQDALGRFVSDYDWIDRTLIPTNHLRLRQCHDVVCQALQQIDVPFVDGCAGLYIWADLRQFIQPLDFKTEKAFSNILLDNGVYINSGRSFNCHEPGWFRIVFANDLVKIGMERLGKCLKTLKNNQKDEK